jgi:hypothetical protein
MRCRSGPLWRTHFACPHKSTSSSTIAVFAGRAGRALALSCCVAMAASENSLRLNGLNAERL